MNTYGYCMFIFSVGEEGILKRTVFQVQGFNSAQNPMPLCFDSYLDLTILSDYYFEVTAENINKLLLDSIKEFIYSTNFVDTETNARSLRSQG